MNTSNRGHLSWLSHLTPENIELTNNELKKAMDTESRGRQQQIRMRPAAAAADDDDDVDNDDDDGMNIILRWLTTINGDSEWEWNCQTVYINKSTKLVYLVRGPVAQVYAY